MDPLDTHKAMLDQLEIIAKLNEARSEWLQSSMRSAQGRHAGVLELTKNIEGHAERLRNPPRPLSGDEEPDAPTCEPSGEDLQRLSGVNDALAYLRAEERATSQNLTMLVGRCEEIEETRRRNQGEAKRVAGRITAMLQEMQRGVPRDMVGRPVSEQEVRRTIVERKTQATAAKRKKAPRQKS